MPLRCHLFLKMSVLFAIIVTGVCAQAPTLFSELEIGPVVANDSRALHNTYDFVFCKALKLACFRAGTPIETENGPQAIETIQLGDLVWCQMAPCH